MMTLDETERGPMYTRLLITDWQVPNINNDEYWANKGYGVSG